MIAGYRHCEGGILNLNFSGGPIPWRRSNWSPLQRGWDLSGQGGYMIKMSLARTCKNLDQHREQNITTNQSISHIIIACSNERPKDCMDNNYSLKESDVIPLCMTICGAGLHVHLSGSLGRGGQREKCWSSWTAMLRYNIWSR